MIIGESKYMKNPILVLVIVAVLAVAGFGAYSLSQNYSKSDSMVKKDEEMTPKDESTVRPTDAMMNNDDSAIEGIKIVNDKMADSRYVQYSKSALVSASGKRRVIFFYASWCPTCKSADVSFTQNESKIPSDLTLIRVNYNDPDTDQEEKDLAKKYGITYQHTFVQIDSTGKEVTKWNGGQINELLSKIK